MSPQGRVVIRTCASITPASAYRDEVSRFGLRWTPEFFDAFAVIEDREQ